MSILNRFLFPFLITIASIGLWLLLPENLELARKIPAFFAAISMICMALAMLISARPKWIEPITGGMDKAYVWHKWLGITGLIGASFHWLLVPGPAGNGIDPQLADIGEELGQFAMYGLLLLGGISMVRKIPYRLWFYTHKLMGPIFLISVYHTFFSDVPFEFNSQTGIALFIVSLIGCISWIYKTLFKKRTIKTYHVSKITPLDDAIEVNLTAHKESIQYHSGQFAYLDFGFDNIEHYHPFTITSAPHERELSFIIRSLGKHTSELQQRVTVGQTVKIDGAYGRLHKKRKMNKPQIWIAGGIGITPFVSWLKQSQTTNQEIHLFYTGRGKLYDIMLAKLTSLITSDKVTLHKQENENDFLTGEKISTVINQELTQHQVFACGPTPMLKALKSQLSKKGMKETQWHNENFAMR